MSLNPPDSPTPPSGRTVSVTWLIVIVLVVAGIAIAATTAVYALRPASTSSSPSSVNVTDDLGRHVTVPYDPARVAVLSPSIMDIVYRLGLRDRVVGVGCDAGIPGGLLNEYSPNQSALWNISAGLCISDYPSLDVDELLNLSPEAVFAPTYTSAAAVEEISVTFGIPVVMLNPTTLQGIVSDVQLVTSIFPVVQGNGTALEAALDDQLVSAANFDSNLSTNGNALPTVLLTYYFDSGGYYTYGPDSFGQSLIDALGAVNVAGTTPLLYFELNGSVVLNDSPEIILYGTSWNDPWLVENETPAQWASPSSGAPYWSQLNGTKVALDVTLVSEPDPTLIFELPVLLHIVHPTLYPSP